jgi:hypothetical protein
VLRDERTGCRVLAEMDRVRGEIIAGVAAGCAADADPAVIARAAGSGLERYAAELLEALTRAADGPPDEQAGEWVRQQYHERLASLGTAVRDLIAESTLRHTVAQALQLKMLEAELALNAALDGRLRDLA